MLLDYRCKGFNSLTTHELYAIIRLRNEVFVVEQQCIFQDADDKDQIAYHLMGFEKNELVAYARLLPKGIPYKEVSIGRVITSPRYRNKGLGKTLVAESVLACEKLFGKESIRISAQYRLVAFYEAFGFVKDGEVYDEDGIDHIEMIKT
jgi:ElaA protein